MPPVRAAAARLIRALICCSAFAISLAGLAAGCRDRETPGSDAGASAVQPLDPHDASGDADASVQCCPISEQPACGMHFGGTRGQVSCERVFSGIAMPDDRWQLLTDENGCPQWYEPELMTPWACCGCPTPGDAQACMDVTPDVTSLPVAEQICLSQDSCNICVQSRDAQFRVRDYYVTPNSECGCFIAQDLQGDAG